MEKIISLSAEKQEIFIGLICQFFKGVSFMKPAIRSMVCKLVISAAVWAGLTPDWKVVALLTC